MRTLLEVANYFLEDETIAESFNPEDFGFIPVESKERAGKYAQGTKWNFINHYDYYIEHGGKMYYSPEKEVMWVHYKDEPNRDIIRDSNDEEITFSQMNDLEYA